MREIKFRAWDKQDKRMMYRTIFDRNWYLTPKNDEGGCHCLREITPDDRTVIELMQFTGLLDKNGKEIYEGDVIRTIFDTIGVVKYHIGQHNDRGMGGGYIGFFIHEGEQEGEEFFRGIYPSDDEVIGNIYENPELLK